VCVELSYKRFDRSHSLHKMLDKVWNCLPTYQKYMWRIQQRSLRGKNMDGFRAPEDRTYVAKVGG